MLLNKKQVAAAIGVSYRTLRRWAKGGRLPEPTDGKGRMSYWDESVIAKYLGQLEANRGQQRTDEK